MPRILLPLAAALLLSQGGAVAAKDVCEDYASRVPGLQAQQCRASGLQDMGVRSVQGRTLWGRDVRTEPTALRVLVLGGIHGDEMSSVATVFHWIGLSQQAQSAARLKAHWRFIPALNPDGLFARPSRRVNANGVDLNRNFPTPNWEREARRYWEVRTRRDPRRWPGQRPLSEPESRFLNDQLTHFQPQLIVSVHAPYGLLDFDGPTAPPSRLGRLYLDQVGIYPGSLGNYGGVFKSVPMVTVELPSAAQAPHDRDMRQMWADLLQWSVERLVPPWVASQEAGG